MVKGVIDSQIGRYLDPTPRARSAARGQTQKNALVQRAQGYSFGAAVLYRRTPKTKHLKIAPNQTLGFWTIDFLHSLQIQYRA